VTSVAAASRRRQYARSHSGALGGKTRGGGGCASHARMRSTILSSSSAWAGKPALCSG
jgi:hypothetical protein